MKPADSPPLSRRLPALSGPVLGLVTVLAVFVVSLLVKGEPDSLGRFLNKSNLQVLVHDGIIPAVLALGMLMVIVSGGIDLSVGSVVALVAVATMWVYRRAYGGGASVPAASLCAVGAGVMVGGACGLVNGLLITLLRVSPFVATLGMLSIARGLAVWLAERQPLGFPLDAHREPARPDWVNQLARVRPEYGGVNPGFWLVVVLALAVAVLLRTTVLGRYCYAIGSNEATARLCGVRVGRTKVVIYTLAGLLTGCAGVLMFAQTGTGDPGLAVGLELEVIAAVVIGGASLAGGQGTVAGTLLGVLILGVLTNGVRSIDVPVEIRYILIGLIIVVNTALSQWQRRGAS